MDIETIKTQYDTTVSDKIKVLETEQADYIKEHSKHLQKKRYKDGDLDTEVHEYLCLNGNVGYQVFFYKNDGEDEYVKSIGYGDESKHRTFDWVLIYKIIYGEYI